MFNYSALTLDHFFNPRNVGEYKTKEGIGTGYIEQLSVGTVMQLQIHVCEELIVDAKFKALGCPATIAVCSWLTMWLINKTINEATALTSEEIIHLHELPKEKRSCAMLGVELLNFAIGDG